VIPRVIAMNRKKKIIDTAFACPIAVSIAGDGVCIPGDA
jgi:hypothetical protein